MANMFKCTLASGGALILTVTCDSAFAGQTITCTDGITTLTQICPSSSPYTVEFKIPNAGIWTISSGTTSTSVTIPSSAELHDIPNGSTITPTGDIQIWLHCANIWDKAYTTISQVLADASTLQALIASNNAVDYMARSTTWASSVTADQSAMSYIGLNDYCADALLADSTWRTAICNSTYFESVLNTKVPTMTSNTAPYGTAIASNYISGYDIYKAFDRNTSTAWNCTSTTSGAWIGYEFINPINVGRIFHFNGNGTPVNTFKIQYSDDNSTWNDTGDSYTINLSIAPNGDYFDVTDCGYHIYWRIYQVSSTISSDCDTKILQFYGRSDV